MTFDLSGVQICTILSFCINFFNIIFVIIFNLFFMSLLRSHDLGHRFCMSFFSISFLIIVLFVFDFSRYYSNSSAIYYFKTFLGCKK